MFNFINFQLLPFLVKKVLIIVYNCIFKYMSTKNKTLAQKLRNPPAVQKSDFIENIHQQKKGTSGKMSLLVQWKGRSNPSQWEWKQADQLINCPNFKQKFDAFTSNDNNQYPMNAHQHQNTSKQLNPNNSIQSTHSKILKQQVLKVVRNKNQSSIDQFINPSQYGTNPNQKNQKINQSVNILPSKEQNSSLLSLKKEQTIQSMKDPTLSVLEKIKSIKTFKGFDVKKNGVIYDVEVWDNNGQTLFMPPISSETVKKLDRSKVATFLQDCLARGFHQQVVAKSSRKV